MPPVPDSINIAHYRCNLHALAFGSIGIISWRMQLLETLIELIVIKNARLKKIYRREQRQRGQRRQRRQRRIIML